MIVMKFGGTSLKDAQRIRTVARIVKARIEQRPVVVTSAHHGVTEKLIALANGKHSLADIEQLHLSIAKHIGVPADILHDILAELKEYMKSVHGAPTPEQLDRVVSYGERLSTRTVAACFQRQGIPAQAYDAWKVGMITDSRFGEAQPLPESEGAMRDHLLPIVRSGIVPVVTGFVAKDKASRVTTIGRNGSDYTATLIAAALKVREVQLWSDASGVMTADPRIVRNARPLESITFNEAGEIAYYGRRFHPSTLLPAMQKGIPVRILNTYEPLEPGTVIVKRERPRAMPRPKTIVYKKDIFLITIVSPRMLMQYGFLEQIFKVFAEHKIVIDMIATSEVSVSVTTDRKIYLADALRELLKFAQVELKGRQALVCVVGEDIKRLGGINGDIFRTLSGISVAPKMVSQGATRTNVAFLVDNQEVPKTVRALHRALFER
jgi:aspartate kinase